MPTLTGMPLSDYARDRFIAPELSKLKTAVIPDASAVDVEQEHWLANFILNTLLRADVPSPQRQQMFNFLRRSHAAFTAYASARELTLLFVADPERNLRYIDAIGQWEAFLGHAWQAYAFLGRGKPIWFKPGDGSVIQRLHALHTRAKHAEAAIERGDFKEDAPLCVWLSNEGLRSTDTELSFVEAAEVLDDLARWASAVQDPLTMRDKIQQAEAEPRASAVDETDRD